MKYILFDFSIFIWYNDDILDFREGCEMLTETLLDIISQGEALLLNLKNVRMR